MGKYKYIFVFAFSVCLLMAAGPAGAFKVGRDQNGKVVVFDNDFLDRKFGQTWVPGKGASAEQNYPRSEQTTSGAEERWGETKPKRSLLPAIHRSTSPRRAAALRFAETGRMSLRNGEHQKAVYYFEKALGIDAKPFLHFYLARAHYELADYQRSLGFLEVAESGLNGQLEWLTELRILRRELQNAHPAPQSTMRRDASSSRDP